MSMIFRSLFVIAAVAAIAGGATFAYFSDTAVVEGNTFSAGTLDLKTNDADGVTAVYKLSNLKPGDWKLAGQVKLKNAGLVDGHAWLEITNVKKSGTNSGDLADFVVPSFQLNVEPWTRVNSTKDPISDQAGKKMDLFDLDAGQTLPLDLYAVWPKTYGDLDNTVQGNSVEFDVVFHLEQKI